MQITHQEAFDQGRESKTWCPRRRIGHQGPPLLPYNSVGLDSPYEAADCPQPGPWNRHAQFQERQRERER